MEYIHCTKFYKHKGIYTYIFYVTLLKLINVCYGNYIMEYIHIYEIYIIKSDN
jgi:hypothetical protein